MNSSKIVSILILIIISFSCKNQSDSQSDQETTFIEDAIPIYNFDEFEHLLQFEDEKTYIVNFWATWCKPCVKELPYFEEIRENYKNNHVQVILVSLDFPEKLDTHVKPFIEKHKLKSKIVILDDVDSNRWIPLVSEEWSGAIPATVIYNKIERNFYERSFTYEELEAELNKLL